MGFISSFPFLVFFSLPIFLPIYYPSVPLPQILQFPWTCWMRKKKLMTQVTFGDCSWINMYRANSMQINLPFISPSVLNNSYILQDSIISASLLTSCVALVFLLSKPHFPYLQFFFPPTWRAWTHIWSLCKSLLKSLFMKVNASYGGDPVHIPFSWMDFTSTQVCCG